MRDNSRVAQHKRLWIALAVAAALVGVFVIVVVSTGDSDRAAAPAFYGAVPPGTSRSPSTVDPSGAGVTTIAPGGYKVSTNLCRSANFLPLSDLFGTTTKSPSANRSNKVGYTSYTCNATLAKRGIPTTADVTAMIFGDEPSATAAQSAAKGQAPAGTEEVKVGTSAFGSMTTGDGYRIYQLWVLDKNLRLGVRVKATPATPPTRDQLRDAALGVATATLRKLPQV
jgi:hypothetical protein